MDEREMEPVSLVDRLEELLDNSIINAIFKGLSLAATIIFAGLSIIMILVALIDSMWYLYVLLFIVFGLIAGGVGGFSYYLFDEY